MKAIKLTTAIDHDIKRVIKKVTIIEAPKNESENLDFFYKEIGCNMIDAVSFDAGQFIVDDEGLITPNHPVFEYNLGNDYYKVPLAGNIVAYKEVDNLGRTVWFEDDDVDGIMAVIDIMENAELKGVTRG